MKFHQSTATLLGSATLMALAFTIALQSNAVGAPASGYSQPVTSIWCTHTTADRYNADFNGDREQDALCRDRVTGHLWLALNVGGSLQEIWQYPDSRFCTHAGASFFVGDENRDGRTDIACRGDGGRYQAVDYAGEPDWFSGDEASGYLPDFEITAISGRDFGASGRMTVTIRNLGSPALMPGLTCTAVSPIDGNSFSVTEFNNGLPEMGTGESRVLNFPRISRPRGGAEVTCRFRWGYANEEIIRSNSSRTARFEY